MQFSFARLGAAVPALALALAFAPGADAQETRLLSAEIRSVLEKDGAGAAKKRFEEIYPDQSDQYEMDLQDLPDALGARTLLCPLCATSWRIDRLTCAGCGERSAEQLEMHTAESVPWVRVDECRTCRGYLKTIDLRQRGDAVPIVDELATVELDVWARERGLTKVRTNVLEM